MIKAVAGKDWAFSLLHFVEATTGEYLCPDTWASLGPGRGVYAQAQGGFVDTNCFLIDKIACNDVFPEWAMPRFKDGTGGDRQILQRLAKRPYGSNEAHTVYYRVQLAGQHPYLLWKFRCAGVDLARFVPPGQIPDAGVWQRCAEYDRQSAAAPAAAAVPPGPPAG
jgi:hypothetical protein